MNKQLFALLLLPLLFLPMVAADNFDVDTEITPEEIDQFEEILEPVVMIYNFVKYIATLVAAIFLVYAGVSFMISGNDPRKRDQAKNIAMYVVIGLIVIWAAPMIVNFII